MALVTEDGTGLATAESYVSVADADTYWTNRDGNTVWTAASTAEKEAGLRSATDYVESRFRLSWKGQRIGTTQALSWPRYYVYTCDGRTMASDEVPTMLAYAVAYLAPYAVTNQADGLAPATKATAGIASERVKAGPVEEEIHYIGGASGSTDYPQAWAMLSDLVTGGAVVERVG